MRVSAEALAAVVRAAKAASASMLFRMLIIVVSFVSF
jgi:Cu/Ag efflux pump CusA